MIKDEGVRWRGFKDMIGGKEQGEKSDFMELGM